MLHYVLHIALLKVFIMILDANWLILQYRNRYNTNNSWEPMRPTTSGTGSISTLLQLESKYKHTCTHIYSHYEGVEGASDRTPWCCGAERRHVCADAQEGRGLLIRSAKPDRWASCGGDDGRLGASWERCVHSPCVRFHSHGRSPAAWNIPEHSRSSLQTGTGNSEGRIL